MDDGDPKYVELELGYAVPHKLGGALEIGAIAERRRLTRSETPGETLCVVVRLYPWLLVVGLLGACRDSPPPADSESCGEGRRSPTTVALDSTVPVCGEGGVGFAGHQIGGGLITPGTEVLRREIGASYVVIDPSCRFIAYRVNEFGVAYAGQLTSEQAAEIDAFLSLESWAALGPVYGWGGSVFDAPDNFFAWGERRVHVAPNRLPAPPEDFPHDLRALSPVLAERLADIGIPVCGPVRYSLVGPSGPPSSDAEPWEIRDLLPWPLDTPPEALATPLYSPTTPTVHTAHGEDASRLRELRAEYLAVEDGDPFFESIPVAERDGFVFALYIRDVVEFEADGSPMIPWSVEPLIPE